MSSARETITIAAPPDRVLALLRDPDEAVQWFPFEVELLDPPGDEVCAGDQITSRGELAGQEIDIRLDVEDVSDDGATLVAHGPVVCSIESRLDGDAETTELTVELDVSSGGGVTGMVAAEAAKPLAGPSLRRALECIKARAEE